MNTGAAGILDTDNRAANLDGHVHDLGDLLAEDNAHRTAIDRLVMRVNAHGAAIDAAVTGHNAIRVNRVWVTRGLG